MEEARVLVSPAWQQRLKNVKYQNWVKVGYAIDLVCKGIRPYIEREAKAFYALMTARLHGLSPCTCTHTPTRRRNPYHDMIVCNWARQLLNYHVKPGGATWNQSDRSLWTDPNIGYWEIAKLYMPFGCGNGKVCAADTDATGLLNLLRWCSYYKTDATTIGTFSETRNTWAHAEKQELDVTQLADAFSSMKNVLRDPELVADLDAIDALDKITKVEIENLIDFEDIEIKVVNLLKDFMISIKDEIIERVDENARHAIEIKEILNFCMEVAAERDEILRDMYKKLESIELREKEKSDRNRRVLVDFKNNCCDKIVLLVLVAFVSFIGLHRLIPSRTRYKVLFFILVLGVTVLEENMVDLGCTRNKFEDHFELMQFDFTEYLNRAREGFVGRQWLFQNLTKTLENNQEKSKGVLIIGAPGFGKSALISNLICSKLSSSSIHSQILGYHLCIHSDKNTLNGAKFVRNLANMVAWKLQEYRRLLSKEKFIQRILKFECLSDPAGCFEQGLLAPLLQLQLRFQKPMYIVVDALDECSNENDYKTGGSILDILHHKTKLFPSWLKVIATSRNVTNIRRKLSNLDVIKPYPEDPENLRDIERFLYSKLLKSSVLSRFKSYFLSIEDPSVSNLVKKSQGNFLYIKLVLEYLQTNELTISDRNSLPDSINSVYQDFFERKYGSIENFRAPRKIFEILVATKSPVTINEVYEILSNENKDFDYDYDFLPILEELSMYIQYTEGKQTINVFHNSLTEWLTGETNKGGIFYVDDKKGHRALADYFLKRLLGKTINVNPKFVYDLATYVVIGGNLKAHRDCFLKLDPNIIEVKDNRTQFTALHHAAEAENERTLDILLHFFKDVNIEDNKGRTPAFLAVKYGRLKNLDLLQKKGASLSHVTKSRLLITQQNVFDETLACKRQMCGYNLLHVAAQTGHREVVVYLIKHGVNVSSLSTTGSSAVQLAAEYGHLEIMNMLLLHGAEADNTCLYYAASFGKAEIVKFLLKKGVKDLCVYCYAIPSLFIRSPFIKVFDNLRHCNTALHAAAIGNYPDVIETLLTSKDNAINCVNYFGKEPLHEAVHHNNYQATNVLLKFGVNTLSVCKFSATDGMFDHKFCFCGYTSLHLAAHYGFAAITNLLLDYKADYSATDCEGLQPIHVASCRGQTGILSILVKHGANINSRGPNGMTPIHFACKCDANEIFDKLFGLGADGLALTSDGKAPLHFLIQDFFMDENVYFLDPYGRNPIDPVSFGSLNKNLYIIKHSWLTSSTKYLQSFAKYAIKLPDLDKVLGPLESFLSYGSVLPRGILSKISSILVGSNLHKNVRLITLSSPAPFPVDIGLAFFLENHDKHLSQVMKSTVLPSFVKTKVTNALTVVGIGEVKFVCSRLILFVDHNLVYTVDTFLHLGMDVNCEESGLSPVLAYLRQGGRNMAKILVKHQVSIDIQCGEYFKDSVFHLAAYHKLHYLQYISVFQDPIKWEEYLKEENALFDYLFDEHDKITVEEQVKVIRVRDGPVTKAIKSNFRGFKIINECLDNEGYTALHRAAQGGNVVAVKHFLEWGANASLEAGPDELDPLVLSIWYALKYRPYFNLYKPSLLTSLEIEFASLTAGAILKHLIKNKPFDIGCDHNKKTPTVLHLAATRGMWRFIEDLFKAKDHLKVTGLTANCPTKDNITPMYLAKLYGGDDCDWDNPWCKVVGILSQYGASMIYPDRVTEYFLILNFLFHDLPERFDLNELNQDEIQMIPVDCKGSYNTIGIISGTNLHAHLLNDYYDLIINYTPKDDYFFSTTSQYNHIIERLREFENKFQATKLEYILFLSTQLISMKWSLYFHREIDDTILRCVPVKMNLKPKYQAISNQNYQSLKHEEELTNENIQNDNDLDDDIIMSNWFDPILDMCSSKSTIDFETLHKLLQKNRQTFNKHHKTFAEKMNKAKQTIRQKKVKLGIFDSVNKLFYDFESRKHCEMKEITYKYVRLKFLWHTMKFWSAQVKNLGMYPLVPKFASERIREIFQGEGHKEMLPFIIKLAKVEPLEKYEFMKMLRFSAPPLKEEFIKSEK